MWFWEGESNKDWPCFYVSPIRIENQGSRSSRWKELFKRDGRVCKHVEFVNLQIFREILNVV